MAEELERLRKRNASLQMNLEEVIEERETDRRKIRDLMDKVRNLEKEQDEAYNQYRADVSDLIWQKNRLSESLTSSVENYGADDEPFDDLEEQPSPLRVIENRVQKKRGQAPQHTGLQFEGTKKTVKFTDRQRSSSSDTSSEGDDAPLSGVQKKKYKQIIGSKTGSSKVIQQKAKTIIGPKTSSPSTSSKVIQQKGKQIIGSNTSSANRSSKVIQEVNLNTSEDSEDSGDWGSVSEHCSNDQILTQTQRARMEVQEIKKVISQEKPKLKRKKADPSKETKHGKDNIRKNKTQKTEGVIRKVTEVKENISQSKPNATTAKKTKPDDQLKRYNVFSLDRNEETDDDFVDEWDYNIEKIEKDDWVAVAYSDCDNCFIGQVEEKTQDNLCVNFLSKKNEFFYWPQVPDRDTICDHPRENQQKGDDTGTRA
ncbi:myb-like protein X [Montipora capricornis]|uniref:myb-like protein X n=1 Tax=Montipora capricornis TaxID=246305 RepID=UPI0035F1E6CA